MSSRKTLYVAQRLGLNSVLVRTWLLAVFTGLVPVTQTAGGDWPQILGPQRNGQAENEQLLSQWPADGPIVKWRHEVGAGFAGPVVKGGEVYVFHRVGDSERIERLSAETGQVQWKADFPAIYRGSINPDSGPRCVPLIHGPSVYVFGAAGDLHCVARADGSRRWSRDTQTDFQAPEGYFGAGSTPIAIGELLLVNVGGSPDAGIVAFSLETGETVWQTSTEQASYSAPTQTVLAGATHAVFVTRYNVLVLLPLTGEVRFRFPFGQRGPTVNAATPLIWAGRLFVSSNYGVGCLLAKIDAAAAETIWSSDEVLSSQYNTAVHHERHLFGIHGREDVGQAELRCVEASNGKVQWKAPRFGVAHAILADDKLLLLKVDGTLVLAEANTEAFKQLAEATVSKNVTRALPALADGQLYIKDNAGNQGTLLSVTVGRQRFD